MQFDVHNLKAEESLPTFLAALDTTTLTAPQRQAYRVLSRWNFENDIHSIGATYYEAWWRALFPLVWDEMQESKVALDDPTAYTTIKLIKEKPDLSFFDIAATPEKKRLKKSCVSHLPKAWTT